MYFDGNKNACNSIYYSTPASISSTEFQHLLTIDHRLEWCGMAVEPIVNFAESDKHQNLSLETVRIGISWMDMTVSFSLFYLSCIHVDL